MARISPGSSPVVNQTFRKRRSKVVVRRAISSAVIIVCIILLLCIDMSYDSISGFFGVAHPLLWYIECVIVIYWIFRLFPSLSHLIGYTRDYFLGDVVELTEEQARLLRVQRNETGFKISPKKKTPDGKMMPNRLIFAASAQTPQSSFASEGTRHSPSFYSPYGSYLYSPSQQSPVGYHSMSSSSTLSASHSQSFDRSLNLSSANTSGSLYDTSDHSGLRSRHNLSYSKLSPAAAYDTISDMPTLTRYLKEQEEKERRSIQASPDNTSQGSPSFWSYGSSPMDHMNVLRKYQYQVATRSPQSPTAKTSSCDQSASSGFEEVWGRFGVMEDSLYLWTERLRRWLSLTVIIKLAKEIDQVNSTLQSICGEAIGAGSVSITTLKQLAVTKGNAVPSLNALIPYMDVSANQEYVYRRIKDLATGSMSAFTWNSGGSYGKPWGEHLPTDSLLVVHLVCTYLDSLLPTQPRYLGGKSFTSQHFIKTPDKPDQEKKDTMCIYQSCINPPHYQVIIGKETFNLPKGRNNMFQALLLFFYYIREKKAGMLGRVNIGMSGLNIMWIFE